MPVTPFNIIPANAPVAVNTLHRYLIPVATQGSNIYRHADLGMSRNGRKMQCSDANIQASVTSAACANFAIVGRLPSDLNLPDVFEVRNQIVPSDLNAPEISRNIDYISEDGTPKKTQGAPPPRPPGTNQLALNFGGIVDAVRMGELQNAYNNAVNSVNPYALNGRDYGSHAPGVTRKGAVVFARNAETQEFHELLLKTVLELYGFTVVRGPMNVGDVAIAIRSNDWWGFDHGSIKIVVDALRKTELKQEGLFSWLYSFYDNQDIIETVSVYTQKVPGYSVYCCCDTLWDQFYPETVMKVSHVPAHLDQVIQLLQLVV